MPVASQSPAILDALGALSDSTRCRMLLVLERHELTVGELADVLQLPQSTVSRHLKTLADTGWVGTRRDGTSRFYSLDKNPATAPIGLEAVWAVARDEVADRPGAAQDQRRLRAVLTRRASRSQKFFASSAADWDRLRAELFGDDFFLRGLVALADDRWTVGDLGCGTGAVSEALAPFVSRVVAVDVSAEMLAAARERLDADSGTVNVDLREGALESLPVESGTLDAATMILVLHHVADPAAALAEAARALKPEGRLLIVDMLPHDREQYRQTMGHVWLGFGAEQIEKLMAGAGFDGVRVRALAPASGSKGPALFVATGRKS